MLHRASMPLSALIPLPLPLPALLSPSGIICAWAVKFLLLPRKMHGVDDVKPGDGRPSTHQPVHCIHGPRLTAGLRGHVLHVTTLLLQPCPTRR